MDLQTILIGAAICLVAFLISQNKANERKCDRPKRDDMWKYDFNYVYNWSETFTLDCSRNAHKIRDASLFDGERGYEDLTENDIKFGGQATTCHTTAYAFVNYFCGEEFAYLDEEDKSIGLRIFDTYAMKKFVKWHPKGMQAVFRGGVGQMDSDGKSHVYVLQALPDQTFHWYQSFLEQYTLKTHMDLMRSRNMVKIPKKKMLKFLDDLEKLDGATEWTTELYDVYYKYFRVKIDDLGSMDSWFKDTKIGIHYTLECFADEKSKNLWLNDPLTPMYSLPLMGMYAEERDNFSEMYPVSSRSKSVSS